MTPLLLMFMMIHMMLSLYYEMSCAKVKLQRATSNERCLRVRRRRRATSWQLALTKLARVCAGLSHSCMKLANKLG